MELEQRAIWADIRKIFNSEVKPVRFEYRAKIHTDEDDIPVMKIISIDILRDYIKNIGDVISIEFLLPMGDYINRLYPFRNNLEMTVEREILNEAGVSFKSDSTIEVERYKVVFLSDKNFNPKSSEYETLKTETLNLMDTLTIHFQLLNRALEPLRIKTTGGIFKKILQKDVIHSLLLGESKQVLLDGKPCIDGLNMIEPDNTEEQRHVIIPQGTLISSVPTYCQEKMNGVYNAGIGTYLQSFNKQLLWFVYPLYNPSRFTENVKKVIFYSTPRTRFPGVERTYREDGDILYIAATSGKAYTDTAETDLMKSGSGFRLTDARSFMGKPVEMTEEGPVAVRNRLNHEVSTKARDDNLNYAPVADRDISGNPFAQYSRVLERSGGRVDLTWNNSNPQLIYPGMPCNFVFENEKGLQKHNGIIVFIHTVIQIEDKGLLSRSHTTTSQIALFVEQFKE